MSENSVTYAVKYRPHKLSEYVGNEPLKRGLLGTLRGGSRPQVILMQGSSGCGKTTFARLIAKEYFCTDRNEDTGACNHCYNCQQMNHFIETGDYGMLPNLKEVDVSDAGKKQDIDLLLEDSQQPSFNGEWKVYILDECHLMSAGAQGRLLKTLEEPPEKVLFILCTTDPQKMLDTILSRCRRIYKVTKPSKDDMIDLLKGVLTRENVPFDKKGLNLVAAKSGFAPRKALMLAQQLVAEKGDVTYASADALLNLAESVYYVPFFKFLSDERIDTLGYIALLATVHERVGINDFVHGLTEYLKRGIYALNGARLDDIDPAETPRLKKIFGAYTTERLTQLLVLFVQLQNEKDVEAKLLMLGYTGLDGVLGYQQAPSQSLLKAAMQDSGVSKLDERLYAKQGDFVEPTDTEKPVETQKISGGIKSLGDIAERFGGSVLVK